MNGASALPVMSYGRVKVLPLAVFLNIVITMPLAAVLNIWLDEAYTLHTTARDLSYAWQQSIDVEQNAPLYFLIMTLWRHIDGSVLFARLFSILCVAAAVSLIPAVVRRYLPKMDPSWIIFAVALNPFLIWAAVEIRLYALVILLSVLLLLTFHDAFLTEKRSRAAWCAYVGLSIVSAYTWYLTLCLIVAQGVFLFAKRRRAIPAYTTGACFALLASLPLVALLPSQMASYRISYVPPASFPQSIWGVGSILSTFLLGLNVYPSRHVIYLVTMAASVAAALTLARYVKRSGDAALPILCAVAALLLAMIVFVSRERIVNRHAAFLLVPAILSVYAAFTFLRQPVQARATQIWSSVTIVVGMGCLLFTYWPLAKMGDWERIVSYIAASDPPPSDPILVFDAENALPLAYYDRGAHPIVPIPRPIDFRKYDESAFVVHNDGEIVNALKRVPRVRVWFVLPEWCREGTTAFGCDVVLRYINQHYKTITTRDFYKSQLQALEPKDQSG